MVFRLGVMFCTAIVPYSFWNSIREIGRLIVGVRGNLSVRTFYVGSRTSRACSSESNLDGMPRLTQNHSKPFNEPMFMYVDKTPRGDSSSSLFDRTRCYCRNVFLCLLGHGRLLGIDAAFPGSESARECAERKGKKLSTHIGTKRCVIAACSSTHRLNVS